MLHLLRLFAKKTSFDEIPYQAGTSESLDWDVIKESFKQVGKKVSQEVKAKDLQLIVEHNLSLHPTYGGLILFGKQRLSVFPDALIRCARFKGTDKARILDMADLKSYPTQALEEAIMFVERNTRTGAEIGRLRRVDIPEYPPVAVREAITNAIVHSDYGMKGISIMIAIFDDRIEITNPGGLTFGLTLENALSGSSRIRNRVIAQIFRELKLIEHWGSGLQRIIAECEELGLEMPKFEELNNQFKVTLYSTKAISLKLNQSQQNLIELLKESGKVSTKEAAEFWGISQRNARENLSKLIEDGFLKRIGTSPHDPLGVYMLAPGLKKDC